MQSVEQEWDPKKRLEKSMQSVELAENEKATKERIIEGLKKARRMLQSPGYSDASTEKELIQKLGRIAHELHMSLKAKGIEPEHHRYMIENRGLDPDDPKFYEHIHPLEDLLKFIEDTSANNDPEDKTINVEFEFRVFSRRWDHDDVYSVKRTKTGWNIGFISIKGSCDRGGKPYLYDNLNHDSIAYPSNLHWWLEWLWDQAQSQGLTAEQVQEALNQLSSWLRSIEENAPHGGVWSGFSG